METSIEFVVQAAKMAGLTYEQIDKLVKAYKMVTYGKEGN
mgnify:FL=1